MDLAHGFGLFFIGMTLTVIGFGIALTIGSRQNKPKEKLTTVQQSLKDLMSLNGKGGND